MSYLSPLGTSESIQPVPSAQPGHITAAGAEHELLVFWRSFLRRKWLFLGIVVGFVALVAAVTIITPKSYTTTVRLMAGSPGTSNTNSDTALPILNALVLQTGQQTAETVSELAQQDSIAEQVAKNLNLNASAGDLLSRVTVKPVPNTAILDLSVKWRNPDDSARIANEFATVFTNTERQYVQAQAKSALGFLNAELPKAEKQMHDAANRLADFQAKSGLIDAGTQTQQIVARQAQIDSKIQEVTLDLQAANALDSGLRAEMNGMPASNDPALNDIKAKLVAVESQLAIDRQQFTEAHPDVVSLKQQRDALRSEIASQPSRVQSGEAVVSPNPVYETVAQQETAAKSRADADKVNLAELHRLHDDMAKTMTVLPQKSIQLATLQERSKLATDVYQALQQKHTEASIAQTTAISDVSIVQSATAGGAVVTPNLRLNLTIAPIVGLVLATIVVFLMEYLERKVRDVSDVRNIGLPVIASIPLMQTNNARALPWLQSMTVEAFLHLCVTLRMSKRKPLRSLAITSPSVGDGKSTIAFNLAKALSNLQPRVLLVDADLRRSVLHVHAERPNELGLSDVLTGEHTLEECVQTVSPQFDLLSAGQSVPSPIALLQSPRFDELLGEAAQHYSITIIDSPALSCVADGFAIASRADGTALIIAANTTDERVAKDVVAHFHALGIDNLVGVVLNRDRQRIHDYSDYFAGTFNSALPKGSA